jgi:biotin carboxyl carrier protein
MTFKLKLQLHGSIREHILEAASEPTGFGNFGKTDVLVDGAAVQLDWALIAPQRYSLLLQGRSYQVRLRKTVILSQPNESYTVYVGNRFFQVELQDLRNKRHRAISNGHRGTLELLAPMPGKIVKILSAQGSFVASGEGLLVIEAMKMQNEIRASRKGRVDKVYVREGESVEAGTALLVLS